MELLSKKIENKSNSNNLKVVDCYQVKYPTWKENLSFYFSQYCGITSIHGVQYLGERGRLFIERLLWSIVITILWCICLFLITRTYNKWSTSPVIVTFATTETPISEIPFPAVTICPEANSDPEIFNYTDVLIKKVFNMSLTKKENKYFDSFSLVCQEFGKLSHEYGVDDSENLTTEILETVTNLRTAFPDTFVNLSVGVWQRQLSKELVSRTLSSAGISLTFNMLDYTEIFNKHDDESTERFGPRQKTRKWSLDEGYSKKENRDTFPRRSFESGMDGGFGFLAVTLNDHSKYSCNSPMAGYKVVLHHPCEIPNMDKHVRLPLDQIVFVAIKPRMITISENLKPYEPKDRKCYLTSERKLNYFKSYTQENCIQECLLNYTLDTCKCLPIYMLGYNNIPTCGLGSLSCLENVKDKYVEYKVRSCDCLPSCTSLEYDVEISQNSLDWHPFLALNTKLQMGDLNFSVDTSSFHFSFLYVYYKEMQFLTSERNELYGYADFFSNVGGLLGLFIGFSVTSIIEILYFLTMRLRCNLKIFGKKFWSGEQKLIDKYNAKYTQLK